MRARIDEARVDEERRNAREEASEAVASTDDGSEESEIPVEPEEPTEKSGEEAAGIAQINLP